jgi:hypothetical protein
MRAGGTSGLSPTDDKTPKQDTERGRYYEVIKVVVAACRIKGWDASIDSRDNKFHLATIKIVKRFGFHEVSGLVHLTVAPGLSIASRELPSMATVKRTSLMPSRSSLANLVG